MTRSLNRYDAVVFLSTTGDVLNATQQRAFERYIQAGGGYAGIHAAADTEYDWNWYGHLVGGYFLSHPPGTPAATVHRRGRLAPLDRGPAGPAGREWTSGTTTARPTTRTRTSRTATTACATAACTCCSRWTRRPTARRTATIRWPTTIRSRGASATTAAAPGTPAWATPRPRSPSSRTCSTCSAASRRAAGMPGTEGCDPPNERPGRAGVRPTRRTGTAPLTVAVLGQRLRRGRRPARPYVRGTSATAARPSRQNPDHTYMRARAPTRRR